MTALGTGIFSLLATAWLQGIALGLVAVVAERLGTPAALRQFLWRGAILLPPLATAAVILGRAFPDVGAAAMVEDGGWVNAARLGGDMVEAATVSSVFGVLGWAWLALALIHSWRTIQAHRHLASYIRRIPECSSDIAGLEISALARAAGLPPPVLRSGEEAGPFAAGLATIVVPRWTLELPAGQRQAVLAHEVRHLRRRDPLWSALLTWMSGALMMPFGPLALRRLAAIAEDDCDGWAASREGGGQDLAEALLICAVTRSTQLPLVSMMAGPDTSLHRVRRLVEGEASAMPRAGLLTTIVAGALLSLSCLSVPALSFEIGSVPERHLSALPVPPEAPTKTAVAPVPQVVSGQATVTSAGRPRGRHRRQAGEPVYPALGGMRPLEATAAPLGALEPLKESTTTLGPLTG